ncbi:Glycolate dehydrogenase, FAD-binding subunit GlcE [Polaromonas sp. CG9_12]|nr:Glycolate dehydrogenase, FAD-binding subunit GlcE [Polaromonas sp. CG9_12]
MRIRGGGSKDFYGQALRGDVLDMDACSGVISYEPSELVVTVRGGTPLAELEALLAEQGQCLPFEPPHFGPHATVGGMVASGLSGPARASSGAVRDYLLGVVLLNGKGECLTFGGQVMKNVAGYDVSRLMAGTLGTLGVLMELSLKVLPVAPGEATLQCSGLSQQKALDLLNRWGGQPLPLNASCWVRDASAAPAQDLLFVRLRGALAAVEAACPRMVADVQAAGGQAVPMDPSQAGADWHACREQTLPFFAQPPSPDACLWRLSVPQTAPAMNLPYVPLVEWHGGLRWLWAPASAAEQLRQLAGQAGGHATLFRRAALMPENVPVFTPLSPVQSRIQRELKKQFDPAGIFNPGRMPMDG